MFVLACRSLATTSKTQGNYLHLMALMYSLSVIPACFRIFVRREMSMSPLPCGFGIFTFSLPFFING